MAYRSSSSGQGHSDTPSTTVPTGVATDDIVILTASSDSQSASFTGKWPTGFTELFDSDCSADGQSGGVAWKRLTGADSGSYTLSALSASADWVCQAAAFSGRHTTTAPTGTFAGQNTGQSSPVSINATGFTASAGDDACWIGLPDVTTSGIGNGMAPPTNYTERQDAEEAWTNLSIATRDNLGAGATGTVTGTFSLTSGTSGWMAYLIQLPAAPGGGGSLFTITLDTSITPVTQVVKQAKKILASSIPTTSAIAKKINKVLASSITPVSQLIKRVNKVLSMQITPVTQIVTATIRSIILSVSITPVSQIIKVSNKVLSGSIPIASTIFKVCNIVLSASITPTTQVVKVSIKNFTSAILVTSEVIAELATHIFFIVLDSSLTPATQIVKTVNKTLLAQITPATQVVVNVLKVFASSLTPVSQLVKSYIRSIVLASSITPVSQVITAFVAGSGLIVRTMYWVFKRRRG